MQPLSLKLEPKGGMMETMDEPQGVKGTEPQNPFGSVCITSPKRFPVAVCANTLSHLLCLFTQGTSPTLAKHLTSQTINQKCSNFT
jgi:hypothetical protein